MCGIIGILRSVDNAQTETIIYRLLELNRERGRDGYGCFFRDADEPAHMYKSPGVAATLHLSNNPLLNHPWRAALVNCRAEPMTERVFKPGWEDQQPYRSPDEQWAIVHNGIVANDKELIAKFGLTPPTQIDSWVIAGVLGKAMDWRRAVQQLQGSIALIGMFGYGSTLFFATNYRPLYHSTFRDGEGNVILTALSAVPYDKEAQLVPPYTIGTLVPSGELTAQPAFRSIKPEFARPRTLVVCSGGLDSTVVAAKLAHDGHVVTLLHFDYNCRAAKQEREAVLAVAGILGIGVRIIDTDIFRQIGHSRLLQGTSEYHGEAGAEQAIEWVPARNTIMASIAMGIAEAEQFDHIALGINLEEAGGGYTDNCLDLYHGFNNIMQWIIGVNKRLSFIWPVGNLMKHEIVKLGLEVQAPFDVTWSCYNAGNKHCGDCGPCIMRRRAFEVNGQQDPVFACEESNTSALPSNDRGNFVI